MYRQSSNEITGLACDAFSKADDQVNHEIEAEKLMNQTRPGN